MLILSFCGSALIISVLAVLKTHCRVRTPVLHASIMIPPVFSFKAPGGT